MNYFVFDLMYTKLTKPHISKTDLMFSIQEPQNLKNYLKLRLKLSIEWNLTSFG